MMHYLSSRSKAGQPATPRPITQGRGKMSVLDEIAQQIRTATATAEAAWTYREVCAQLLDLLDEIVHAEESPGNVARIAGGLVYSLQLARAVSLRDASLTGVTRSLEYLADLVDARMKLDDPSVRGALEAVLLDIMLCVSEH